MREDIVLGDPRLEDIPRHHPTRERLTARRDQGLGNLGCEEAADYGRYGREGRLAIVRSLEMTVALLFEGHLGGKVLAAREIAHAIAHEACGLAGEHDRTRDATRSGHRDECGGNLVVVRRAVDPVGDP